MRTWEYRPLNLILSLSRDEGSFSLIYRRKPVY